ncbi:MAG: hypothetical protein H8E90_01470 [Anaerolineales bacterium]|nr:hypothetical protein [Anaerolineales bacterium]
MELEREMQEEELVSMQLAAKGMIEKVDEAIEALKKDEPDWTAAKKAVKAAMKAWEGYAYGYAEPEEPRLKGRFEAALKAIEDKDAGKAIKELEKIRSSRYAKPARQADPASAPSPVKVLLENGELDVKPGRRYEAVAIRAGEWKGHGLWAGADVLKRNVRKFNGLASFLNPLVDNQGTHGHPSVEQLLGLFSNARWDEDEQGVVGDYDLVDTPAAAWFGRFADALIEARDRGEPVPDVGLSAVPWVLVGDRRSDGLREVRDIVSVDQLDAVFRPAAGGELKRILASVGPMEVKKMEQENVQNVQNVQEKKGKEWLAYMKQQAVDTALSGSGLPATMQTAIRNELGDVATPGAVDQAIERHKKMLADLQQDQVVTGLGRPLDQGVTGMMSSVDRITKALEALIEGRRPKDGVRPLSGIREAYILMSGDYEMRGLFVPENVHLAAVDSTTMAGIVANVLNKVVVNQFQKYPKFWEPLVTVKNFTTLQQVSWITLGGIGELPTVPEGAAYTEMTWDDQRETDDWVKKGGYLGITLEAIDRDDTRRIQQAGPALAQGAFLTLGKTVAAIWTAQTGTGPNMSDGNALFDAANHSNLGSSALSPASWRATKIAMRKQTELNSGERLGGLVVPKFCLVPPDLEDVAIEYLATGNVAETTDWRINPDAEGETREERLRNARKRVIVVDFWTDTDNWAAQADPNLYPGIGVGFRFGEAPEIFSVADDKSGLMFSNDVMPIKVRFFFAVGPTDWRPHYKHNV